MCRKMDHFVCMELTYRINLTKPNVHILFFKYVCGVGVGGGREETYLHAYIHLRFRHAHHKSKRQSVGSRG